MDVTGSTALVTGGGIGEALARGLAARPSLRVEVVTADPSMPGAVVQLLDGAARAVRAR